ncbi:MAG: TetR/AcrR family transcriptional regulator [Streptosporangiaceae bacterium]
MGDPGKGLREHKKRQTRQAITGAAMRLFFRHGFEQVTISQIAAAAQVSEKTIYNYFPAKADLVFDERDEIIEDMLRVLRQRPPGQPALAAMRAYFASVPERVGRRRPPEPDLAFRQLIRDSAILRAHQREVFARFEQALAAELARETGMPDGAAEPFIAAAAFVSVVRVNLEGRAGDTQACGLRTHDALDLLARGLGGYAPAGALGSGATQEPHTPRHGPVGGHQ